MAAEVEIAPIAAAELEELLPLIAAYQRFYEVEEVDEERNRLYIASHGRSLVLAAFLGPGERRIFADRLTAAMSSWRSYWSPPAEE